MRWLAVVGGGGGSPWPPWAIVLFLIVFVAIGIFVFTKLFGNRRR